MITGMEQPIEPPPLRKRKWGVFTDIAEELVIEQRGRIVAPGEDTPLPAGIQSSSVPRGVTFTPYGCNYLTVEEAEFCADTASDPSGPSGDRVTFEAFTIRAAQSCSALDVDLAWLNDRIAARWNTRVSAALVAEIMRGPNSGSSPSFAQAASVPFPSTYYDPVTAVGIVEALLADKIGNAEGLIFVNPAFMTPLAETLVRDGDRWRTAVGNTVVADAGASGAVPDDGKDDPEVGWIYGSGLVGYKLGPPRLTDQDAVEYLDRTRNIVTGRKLADAVVAFDPCAVVAVGAYAFGGGGS